MSKADFLDSDDYFASSRMSFGDHLEDLRKHLIRAGIGFAVCFFLSFFIGQHVLGLIKAPVEKQLKTYRDEQAAKMEKRRDEGNLTPEMIAVNNPTRFIYFAVPKKAFEEALKGNSNRDSKYDWKPKGQSDDSQKPPDDVEWVQPGDCIFLPISVYDPLGLSLGLHSSLRESRGENQLSTLAVQEGLMTYFMVCVVTGIILGSPVICWEIWTFVAAGLYPHEKKYVYMYLPVSLILFLGGVALCQFAVMPVAVAALLGFNDWIGLTPELRLSEWLGFAILMPLVFGLSFQTPLVILFLDSLGILDVATIQSKRGMTWFVMAIFAAVITPSADPFSMIMLWIPLGLLFEVGILMCKIRKKGGDLEIEVPDRDELVGV
jgi:sec-independent protein translocase protein TatC